MPMNTEAKTKVTITSQEHTLPRTSENKEFCCMIHAVGTLAGSAQTQRDSCKATAEAHTPSTQVSRETSQLSSPDSSVR